MDPEALDSGLGGTAVPPHTIASSGNNHSAGRNPLAAHATHQEPSTQTYIVERPLEAHLPAAITDKEVRQPEPTAEDNFMDLKAIRAAVPGVPDELPEGTAGGGSAAQGGTEDGRPGSIGSLKRSSAEISAQQPGVASGTGRVAEGSSEVDSEDGSCDSTGSSGYSSSMEWSDTESDEGLSPGRRKTRREDARLTREKEVADLESLRAKIAQAAAEQESLLQECNKEDVRLARMEQHMQQAREVFQASEAKNERLREELCRLKELANK